MNLKLRIWAFRMWLARKIIGRHTAFLYNASLSRDGQIHGVVGQSFHAYGCMLGMKPDETRRERLAMVANARKASKFRIFAAIYLILAGGTLVSEGPPSIMGIFFILATIFGMTAEIMEALPATTWSGAAYRKEANEPGA